MNYFIKNLAQRLETYQIISNEEYNIYYYGFEILFSTVFTSLSILFISCIMDSIIFGVIYLFITMPLRFTLGGYHADTYIRCFLVSNMLYCTISILINLCLSLHLPISTACFFLLLSSIYLYCSKPTRNPHHPVADAILVQNKKIANYFLTFDIILILLSVLLNINTEIIFLSVFSIISVSFLKIIVYTREELS